MITGQRSSINYSFKKVVQVYCNNGTANHIVLTSKYSETVDLKAYRALFTLNTSKYYIA